MEERGRFRCDRCGHEEERPADQTTHLCPVCGYLRWERIDAAPGRCANRDREAT